jgi:ZIP family zinc transporter
MGTVLGFTAGLLIAFVCFEMLPGALARWGLYYGIAAILAGVALSAWLEGRMGHMVHWKKASYLLILGITIHNIPEGMALGSMLHISFAAGLSLAIMIAIHCFPESLAATLPMRESGMPVYKILIFSLVLALPMAIGAFAGALLSSLSNLFVDACLCFSGGVMLYITCGDILPESKDLWSGRLTAIGAMFGFVSGVWLTSIL